MKSMPWNLYLWLHLGIETEQKSLILRSFPIFFSFCLCWTNSYSWVLHTCAGERTNYLLLTEQTLTTKIRYPKIESCCGERELVWFSNEFKVEMDSKSCMAFLQLGERTDAQQLWITACVASSSTAQYYLSYKLSVSIWLFSSKESMWRSNHGSKMLRNVPNCSVCFWAWEIR